MTKGRKIGSQVYWRWRQDSVIKHMGVSARDRSELCKYQMYLPILDNWTPPLFSASQEHTLWVGEGVVMKRIDVTVMPRLKQAVADMLPPFMHGGVVTIPALSAPPVEDGLQVAPVARRARAAPVPDVNPTPVSESKRPRARASLPATIDNNAIHSRPTVHADPRADPGEGELPGPSQQARPRRSLPASVPKPFSRGDRGITAATGGSSSTLYAAAGTGSSRSTPPVRSFFDLTGDSDEEPAPRTENDVREANVSARGEKRARGSAGPSRVSKRVKRERVPPREDQEVIVISDDDGQPARRKGKQRAVDHAPEDHEVIVISDDDESAPRGKGKERAVDNATGYDSDVTLVD